ncbi:MAG: AIM24 family protein [Myxococcota bacterium]|nr:AIM24 family protein [Myxococcota bacterium]
MLNYPHWNVISESEGSNTKWQIFGYPEIVNLTPPQDFDISRAIAAGLDIDETLKSAATPRGFVPIHPVSPVKQVRVTVDDGSVIVTPGAMQATRGKLDMVLESVKAAGGLWPFIAQAITTVLSGESMVKPRYIGTGEVLMEAKRGVMFLIDIKDETFVCDRSHFVACDGSLKVDGMINHWTAILNGGEGLVMPRCQGTGTVLMESPVGMNKIMVVDLNDETLRVDGTSVMAFWGDIQFKTEKVGGFFSSWLSGEGHVNTYTGTGTVWINLEEAGAFDIAR